KGRAADDLEHVGGGGLLLQRFGEVVRALAQLVQQPRVLDGDDGLLGEIAHQLDLLVGEWPHFLAVNADYAEERVLLQHPDGHPPYLAIGESGLSAAMSAIWTARIALIV